MGPFGKTFCSFKAAFSVEKLLTCLVKSRQAASQESMAAVGPAEVLINSQGAAFQASVQATHFFFHELLLLFIYLFFLNSHDHLLYFFSYLRYPSLSF